MSEPKIGRTAEAGACVRRAERGIGMLEMLIVVLIVSIVSGIAVMGVTRARNSIRLQNSMRLLASRVEKARLDAIRRHGSAVVDFTSNKTYTIAMDFQGTGDASKVRTYNLEEGIIFTNSDGTAISTADLPTIDFDWRGGTTQCFTTVRMQSQTGASSMLAVTSTGDVTINSTVGETVLTGTYATVSQTSEVWSSATIAGSSPATCDDPCGGCGALPTGPISSSPPPGCFAFTPSEQSITIKRNGGTTASFSVTAAGADTITLAQSDGRTNLQFTPATQTFAAGATKTFTVKSLNNSWGTFPVKFISACSSTNNVSAKVVVTK